MNWISVKDRLPPTFSTYDCYGTNYCESDSVITDRGVGVYINKCDSGREGFYMFDSDPKYNCRTAEQVNFWMPLPEPPKQAEVSDET